MRYYENNQDFKDQGVSSIFDFAKIILTSLFFSPIRLINEVSSKILFTGEHLKLFLRNCIFLNLLLLVLVLGSSFISKRLYFTGTLMPFTSLIVSLALFLLLYFLNSSVNLGIELSEEFDKDSEIPNDKSSVNDFTDEDEIDLNLVEHSEEILTEDNIEEVFNGLVKESIPVITPEVDDKLNSLLANLKNNVEDFTPSSNVTELYINEKDLEKECVNMIRERECMVSDMSREELFKELANAKPFPIDDSDDDIDGYNDDTVIEAVTTCDYNPLSFEPQPEKGEPVDMDLIKSIASTMTKSANESNPNSDYDSEFGIDFNCNMDFEEEDYL